MAAPDLTGRTISSTYKDLLQVSNSNDGVDGTLRDVQDGEGTVSKLQLSTAGVKSTGTLEATGATTLGGNLTLGGATVAGIKDEDTMSSNSATHLATQQSIKAYVDTKVTAEDLDVAGDSGTLDIDLDSEALTIAGGTNATTAAAGTTVTVNVDDAFLVNDGDDTTSGTITAAGFAGPLTGDVTGDVSGSSGSCTGLAATVTTNANLTGDVTSIGNATTYALVVPLTKGGSGQATAQLSINALTGATGSITDNYVLTKNSSDNAVWAAAPGASGGEANTGSNVESGSGTEYGIFKQKTGVDLEFKKIKQGSGITLTENANDITIVASSGSGTVTSVTAGAGMTQSGTSTVNPTLDVIGGVGITANANDIAHTAHTGDVTGATALTIVAGAVDIAHLSASGSAGSSNFLRGDNSWVTPTDTNTMGSGFTVAATTTGTGTTVTQGDSLTIAAGTGITTTGTSDGVVTIASTVTDTTYTGGTNLTLSGTTFNVDDAFLKNDASDTTTGTITAGGFTTTGTWTMDTSAGGTTGITNVNITNAFTDDDVTLMSAGAIKEKIEGYSYTTNTGTAVLTGSTNNTVCTVTGANALQGEANLTFDGTDLKVSTVPVKVAGLEDMWVPANAMRPSSTNGCAAITDVETTATRPDMQVLDFDSSTQEYAQFSIGMPKSWNGSTVTATFYWTHATAVSTNVIWGIQGVCVSDNDTIDIAYGTAVTVTDTFHNTAEDLAVSAATGAITLAGSPADGDLAFFQVYRDADAGGDTTNSTDARLVGVKIHYTTDAANDA